MKSVTINFKEHQIILEIEEDQEQEISQEESSKVSLEVIQETETLNSGNVMETISLINAGKKSIL